MNTKLIDLFHHLLASLQADPGLAQHLVDCRLITFDQEGKVGLNLTIGAENG